MRKKIPLIVGGSGLYVRSLVDGLFESPVVDENIRLKLQDEADKKEYYFYIRDCRTSIKMRRKN